MKLETIHGFNSMGSAQLQLRGVRALAIHSSSDVDLFRVGSFTCGVGGILPLHGNGAVTLEAVRNGPPKTLITTNDGTTLPQTLVLQCYEDCDPLVPPGPRAPTFAARKYLYNEIPTTYAAASPAFRLPTWGRSKVKLYYQRTSGNALEDLSLSVVGVFYGKRHQHSPDYPCFVELSPDLTWWRSGEGAPRTFSLGNGAVTGNEARATIIENEFFDEFIVTAWGALDANLAGALVGAEAFGESVYL